MNALRTIRPWALAAAIGIAYDLILVRVWSYLSIYNPLTNWLLDEYASARPELFTNLVVIHDLLVNIVLAYPFALLISHIRPDRRWWYVAIAVGLVFLWEYRVVCAFRTDNTTSAVTSPTSTNTQMRTTISLISV